jgi:hypothetical protein
VPGIVRDFLQGERALSTQTIELQPAGYGKEQVGDPRRWFALPVLLTGAFLRSWTFAGITFAVESSERSS